MRSIFSSATAEAERLHTLDVYFIVASLGIFLLVAVLATYYSIKFIDKGDGHEPEQTSSNLKLEAAMIGGPLLLVVLFFFLSINTTRAILPPAGLHTPAVRIIGHQWWWEAAYPNTDVKTANEIHLPVGQRLLIEGT